MFENILQDGEIIELQEDCAYCGDGALAAVNNGHAILTNRRFIVCKKAGTSLTIILGLAIAIVLLGVQAVVTGRVGGVIAGAICGAVGFGLASVIVNLFVKDKSLDKSEISFERENIANAEEGNRGVRKMLVVSTKNGDICKIGVRDKEKWRLALLK